MTEPDPVLTKMKSLLIDWESNGDRRLVFLSCYEMMTQNILTAIATNDFEDTAWVNRLMNNFADLYFQALAAYENEQTHPPAAWKIAPEYFFAHFAGRDRLSYVPRATNGRVLAASWQSVEQVRQ